ncbi:MAG: DUF2628 domain-containing protein [Alphaproteobacteria bacterium]|nr:DUF2628 domain-containing protein [Alphaproteobacteria bacterium]MBO7642294.1 DUF2628 domain-containing protein [Alphaproteobacteria bacterium]
MSRESRAEYYEKAFDRLEKTGKHTWNWAAFLWGFSWMRYRKIYLSEIAFCFIYWILCLALLIGLVSSAYETESTPWGFLTLLISLSLGKKICLGYFGNALYYWTVKKRISWGYHLLEKYRPTSIAAIFFSFILWIADAFSHETQLDKLDKSEVNAETIHAYLNPNKKNHWMVKISWVLACVFYILIILLNVVLNGATNRLENLSNKPSYTSSFADKIEDLRYSPKK